MTTLYKLTDENDRTYSDTQWGEGITHTVSGEGDLCGPGWIHAYIHPLLAVFLNPIHASLSNYHLWLSEGKIGKTDHGLKVGCTSLTTLFRIEPSIITTEHRVRFSILCTLGVYSEPLFVRWANQWLSGEDRSEKAARAAAEAAARAANIDLIAIALKAVEGVEE